MPRSVTDLKNLSEVAAYWQECLSDLTTKSDMTIAGYMTGVVSCGQWDNWYQEGKGDPIFVEAFDLVANLETPVSLSQEERQIAWAHTKELVAELAQKYLPIP